MWKNYTSNSPGDNIGSDGTKYVAVVLSNDCMPSSSVHARQAANDVDMLINEVCTILIRRQLIIHLFHQIHYQLQMSYTSSSVREATLCIAILSACLHNRAAHSGGTPKCTCKSPSGRDWLRNSSCSTSSTSIAIVVRCVA